MDAQLHARSAGIVAPLHNPSCEDDVPSGQEVAQVIGYKLFVVFADIVATIQLVRRSPP
jgi:hypothetical protein